MKCSSRRQEEITKEDHFKNLPETISQVKSGWYSSRRHGEITKEDCLKSLLWEICRSILGSVQVVGRSK